MSDLAQLVIRVDSLEAKVASRDLDKLTNAGTFAEKAMKVLAGTLAVMGLAAVAKESAMLAARFETMGVVMRTAGINAGYASAQMTAFENSLRKTGISMIESRNALTSLSTANIDLSKATGLARAAQDLAVVAGINSSEAFARMIHGIKSGEQEVLKTMGLNVQWEASYKRLSATLGKSANDLTEQEKLQARLGVVMNASAGYAGIYEASMSTAGKQMASMTRYVEDLKVKFGAAFGPAIIAGVQAATEGLKGMSAWMDRLSSSGQLKGIADTLGSITAAGIGAITGPMRLLVDHIEAVKNSLLAMGAAAAFSYGNQLIPQVAASIAPMARQLTMVVMLELETIKYATSMGIASGAAAVMRTALMALATPAAALAVGLAALWVATKGIREETERLNDATAKQELFKQNVQDPILAMRADAERLRKQREALTKDGGAAGAATRQNRIDELVNGATKNADGSMKDGMNPAWIESARLYARQIVDGKDALDAANKSLTDRATAETKAAAAANKVVAASAKSVEAYQTEIDAIARRRVALEEGELALIRYDLVAKGFHGAQLQELVLKGLLISADEKRKESMTKETEAMEKYRDEVYKLAAAGPGKIKGSASDMDGQQYADQLNKRDDYQTRLDRLNNANKFGLKPDVYAKELHKLQLESNTVWGAMSYSIENFADRGSAAMASFLNGTKTGFMDMVASLLLDIEKLILKEQVVAPFLKGMTGMNWGSLFGGSSGYSPSSLGNMGGFGTDLGTSWGGAFAGGGVTAPGKHYLVGENGPELFVPGQTGTVVPNGGGATTINSTVTVNVSSGGNVDAKASGNMGAQAASMLEGVVHQTIQKMMRPGGVLNQVGARS